MNPVVTVLITRPRAASEKLAGELKRHGFASAIEPLLAIEPLAAALPEMADVHAVMITSANAPKALEAGDYEIDNLLGLPCFCVGPRTGEGALAFGFRNVHSASGDGTELARKISAALPKGQSVLHIAAQDIDAKARDEMERMGYKVIIWPVYAAVPVSGLTERTIRQLEQQKLDAIVVFSTRTAQVLKGLLSQHALEACCESLSAIGLSAAVTGVLRPLPWRELIAAPAPTEDAVIACLKRLHPVS